jgi:hypothetical protein
MKRDSAHREYPGSLAKLRDRCLMRRALIHALKCTRLDTLHCFEFDGERTSALQVPPVSCTWQACKRRSNARPSVKLVGMQPRGSPAFWRLSQEAGALLQERYNSNVHHPSAAINACTGKPTRFVASVQLAFMACRYCRYAAGTSASLISHDCHASTYSSKLASASTRHAPLRIPQHVSQRSTA